MTTTDGAYRCAECKSWRHLMAWAPALIEGPLDERGDLARYDYVEDCGGLHEDSIHCTKHIDEPIEMFLDGRWCRWWSCPQCHGAGRAGQEPYRYRCPGGIEKPGRYGAVTIHEGWMPAREYAALISAEKAA
jgi:hypothetical protein